MIDTAFFCRTARKRVFTLVELVVAIAIVTLTLAIAVTALRGESPAQKMERSVHEISAFCARIRFRSAEEGRDWVLKFNPEERRFYATAVADDQEQEGFVPGDNSGKFLNEKKASGDEVPTLPRLDLKLDKSFTFETAEGVEGELGNGEELEVFRFFPDGGASGSHKLLLKLKGMQKVFHISKLTGRVLIDEDLPN
ncbi:MAG: prepilin-type N-terminal cleavage/methylation domain-containing protein [Lentisphaeria bacterium]|nr:prepilin-type N-terminal cleavage/methylation domain-containing protein [Lentisphaeria bacterium]